MSRVDESSRPCLDGPDEEAEGEHRGDEDVAVHRLVRGGGEPEEGGAEAEERRRVVLLRVVDRDAEQQRADHDRELRANRRSAAQRSAAQRRAAQRSAAQRRATAGAQRLVTPLPSDSFGAAQRREARSSRSDTEAMHGACAATASSVVLHGEIERGGRNRERDGRERSDPPVPNETKRTDDET